MISYDKLVQFSALLREFISAEKPNSLEFDALAVELFSLQFGSNAPYRSLCESRLVKPGRVRCWLDIPVLPTTGYKNLEITCIPKPRRTAVFYSSGTTGHVPSRHWQSPESLLLYEDSLWVWFREHLVADGSASVQLIVLTPPRLEAPNSSLVHMFDTIRQRLGAAERVFTGVASTHGYWRVNTEAFAERVAGAAVQGIPVLLLGTAFSFVQLLDSAREDDLKIELPRGSRVMETGGYKGQSRQISREALHGLISKQLGVPPEDIVSEYGMSELSSQAYDGRAQSTQERGARDCATYKAPPPRAFRFPAWARARVVSPETGKEVAEGETGLIQVFDLANVFSVMAVQTEDMGIRREDAFELVGRAELAEARGCSLMSAG